ncbi:MAG TPA: hypothetical protein VL899_00800 [Alphaproteobacteria bacterium]|nr:hypothetical protein [Alphaproteobacteria bacterium]
MMTAFTRGGLAIVGTTAMITLQCTLNFGAALAQQPAGQNVQTSPDGAKPEPVPPPAEVKPKGDPRTGVLTPPNVDPKMAKAVPDVDPAMNNPPPNVTPAPPDAPPPTAKPR